VQYSIDSTPYSFDNRSEIPRLRRKNRILFALCAAVAIFIDVEFFFLRDPGLEWWKISVGIALPWIVSYALLYWPISVDDRPKQLRIDEGGVSLSVGPQVTLCRWRDIRTASIWEKVQVATRGVAIHRRVLKIVTNESSSSDYRNNAAMLVPDEFGVDLKELIPLIQSGVQKLATLQILL